MFALRLEAARNEREATRDRLNRAANHCATPAPKFHCTRPAIRRTRPIVAKIDELMALCDRLETSLTTADEPRSRLLEALLAGPLAPDDERELEAAE